MRHLILFIAGLFSLSVSAQNNFKDGYIVLNTGDTVRGQVDDGNWTANPEKLVFRNGGSNTEYKVNDLKSFGIKDETRFERFRFTYQQTATELEQADETFEGPEFTVNAWLRVLYSGNYSLYEWVAGKRTYFFYTGSDGDLKELIYRVKLTVSGELLKDEQFRNRLAMLAPAGDNDAYLRAVNNARYTDDDMIKVFTLLNGGTGNFKMSSAMGSRVDISGGVSVFSFSPKGSIYNDGSGAYAVHVTDFKISIGFVAGVGFTFYSKRNPKALQSRLGINIGSVTINGLNTTGAGSFQTEKYEGTLIVAEPNASVDVPISASARSTFLLGASFGYNIVISNNFVGTFENPGVSIRKKNFPPVDGGFINIGLNATAIIGKSRIYLRAFSFSNIFDSPRTNLKGMGINLTYGILLN